MLRGESPIFDTPDLPSFRRTKPLPKRRRTSESSSRDDVTSVIGHSNSSVPGDDAASDGLVSTESLLALQSYYMPILGGMQDLFKHEIDGGGREYAGVFGESRTGRGHEEDGGEGDSLDHIQQPGNTKKRKVPANLAAMGPGHEMSGGGSDEDEPTDRAIPTGRPDHEYEVVGITKGQTVFTPGGISRKKKMSRATLAGLSHKEMLKSRKRQLAAVLGALTHGDTLALDQALSANYPFAHGTASADLQSQDLVKVRPSRRYASRLARAHKTTQAQLPPSESPRSFPQSDFAFTFHNATSDRLVATKEEVSSLHARFEAELSRQAAKAAEAARQTTAMLSGSSATKRPAKQGRTSTVRGIDTKATPLEQSLGVTPQKTGKKKKRSALANASNPHHLRNYVPSRLPNSGQTNAAQALQNAQNLLTPLPMRFLSADVPPRRRKKSPVANISPLTSPIEEWICPFCEYDLFYGDDADYQRAVNNRKKILKRRRRARERAAAAASGVAAGLSKNNTNPTAAAPSPSRVATS
ncbi:hypothetical protein BDY19DRAFT_986869 [Irpex rosettiformis]|uniref:Uncharacterized protein n=1 Tax=Irpex rosettiformis TaxID=378272 RepID=A0ACB8TVA6_9APHY|nr:hypothetical protein BDY19DRAFT_986869 [Irpex rosettiformis]